MYIKTSAQSSAFYEWFASTKATNVTTVVNGAYGELVCTEVIVQDGRRTYDTTYIMLDGSVERGVSD